MRHQGELVGGMSPATKARRSNVRTGLSLVCLSAILCGTGAAQEIPRQGHTLPENGFEMHYETMGEGGTRSSSCTDGPGTVTTTIRSQGS